MWEYNYDYLCHGKFKYIDKEFKNGKWQYTYPTIRVKNSEKRAIPKKEQKTVLETVLEKKKELRDKLTDKVKEKTLDVAKKADDAIKKENDKKSDMKVIDNMLKDYNTLVGREKNAPFGTEEKARLGQEIKNQKNKIMEKYYETLKKYPRLRTPIKVGDNYPKYLNSLMTQLKYYI